MPHDEPPDAPTFGDLLRRQRRVRDLTQEALAERAGVSVRAISDLERGARARPYRQTANRLIDALGLSGSERAAATSAARGPLPSAGITASASRERRLPRPLTRLIGRDAERREIIALLCEERVRLLSVTGPGGVGKTRLAMTIAAELGDAFRDGIVLVDLAPLSEPSHVVPALAAALQLTAQGSIPLVEAVRRRLSARQLLLVLDNFEHLLAAAPLLSDLLQSAPDVQTLVTSRAVLRLHGEREYPVWPLPTPDQDAMLGPVELSDWAAIQLFVERARDAQPRFRLTDDNAATVAAICRRLDGLPLAIELAAARMKLLTPALLLARLDRALPLLTRGMRDAPPRQRTLQAALSWSYDLLNPSEQALLRCLAVFVGGWTLEAAETVGALSGVPDGLDALAALVEHSLVVRHDGGSVPRFRLLETIREFALEQLVAAGEEARARHAHLHYLLQLAQENDLERLDAEVGTRLARLHAEEANLRTGVAWALDHDPESAVAVLAELDDYWYLTGHLGMGRDLLGRAIRTGAGANRLARARVLRQAAWLTAFVGEHAQAEPLAEAARILAEQVGDAQTLAHVQMCLGDLAKARGDIDRARTQIDAALAQFEALGDRWGMVVCLTLCGTTALDWGDATTAATYFERIGALVVAYDLPSHYHSHYLDNLVEAYHQLGRPEAAMEACLTALQHATAAGSPAHIARRHITLVRLLLERGEAAQALAHSAEIAESLGVFWENGATWSVVDALELAAALLALGQQAACAARLLGAASDLRAAMPRLMSVREHAMLMRDRETITAMLGEPAFTQAWTVGQKQSLSVLVAEAQSALTTLSRGGRKEHDRERIETESSTGVRKRRHFRPSASATAP